MGEERGDLRPDFHPARKARPSGAYQTGEGVTIDGGRGITFAGIDDAIDEQAFDLRPYVAHDLRQWMLQRISEKHSHRRVGILPFADSTSRKMCIRAGAAAIRAARADSEFFEIRPGVRPAWFPCRGQFRQGLCFERHRRPGACFSTQRPFPGVPLLF